MPFYDYACDRCGPFTESRPIAEFASPCACPDCGESAPRTLTAPALGAGTTTAEPSATASPFRRHSGGCGCCAAPSRRVATAVS